MALSRSRLLALALTCAGLLAVSATAEVIPGRNVNMVSGTDWPLGDPFLQRQNEGSIGVSTRNPLHLLAGGNDYRTVDIPGLPEGRMTGDAWQGLYWSRDGGQSWESSLIPGYLQDNSPEGLASPLKGLEAGADAVVRAGTNGLMYYAGIAFNRAAIPDNAHGTGASGKVYVTRFIDDNAKETGNPFRNLGTTIADNGDDTRFLDKPWLAVDVPRGGAANCTIRASGEIPAQTFKGGNVYLSYTAVSGDATNLKTRLFFTRSRDCGNSWSAPVRLTDGSKVDQGTVIAIHPLTGWVYVAWRRIDPVQRTAAFFLAISIDGGRSFSSPIQIQHLPPYTLSDGVTKVAKVFEQGTSLVSFRTTGFPALTVDALGVVYVAWSERGRGPGRDARIVIKRSLGGLFWWFPAETANPSPARGHELMPSLVYHGGRILLTHYNLVEDHTTGLLTPLGNGNFVETRLPAGDLAAPADPSKVFTEFVADTADGGLKRRHTMEVWVRAAEPTLCDFRLDFTSSTRVSQYAFGDIGDGLISQFQYNPPNLPMFACQGDIVNCKAFIGDYIDLAGGPAFVPKGQGWIYNLDRRKASTAHAIWTDNRDVRPPPPGKTWADYTPPNSPFLASLPPNSLFDPSRLRPVCAPEPDGFTTAGMRNQNLYTSRLTEGLVASSPQNAKQLGFGVLPDGQTVLLQRSFVVVVQNTTTTQRTFRLHIRNQPPDPPTGKASFLQFPDASLPDPLTELFLNVGAKSSATRTVFVTSTLPDASIIVDVEEATQPGGDVIPPEAGGLQDTVVLNPDITNPDITNPDITNPDITNPDITNAEVYNPDITNPDITNPDITNPDITNPDITNPDITNPDITNPDITNAQVFNPDITNPDITNPDITNPDITNPDITNPDITNVEPGSYTDATWTVKDNGNTSGAYDVNLTMSGGGLPPGFRSQLILHRGYSNPVAIGCDLAVQRQSILIANIPNPIFLDPLDPSTLLPDVTNPDITNATLYVAPGDDWAQVTLRLFDPVPSDDVRAVDVINRVTPTVVAQAVNTIEAAQGIRTPPAAVPGTRLVFTQPPSDGAAGVPLSPAVSVQVRDNSGALVPGAPVTLSLASNPSDANLTGNTATTDARGVATFPNLVVDRAGTGYTLRASVGDLAPASSTPFDISGRTADLSVGMTDAPDPVAPGGALTYTTLVTNNGPFTATGVLLTQDVPGPVRSASPGCVPGPPVVCKLGDLDSGQASTVTVVVSVPAGVPSVVSRATASANEQDPAPSDNTATETTTVSGGSPGFSKVWLGGSTQDPTSWFVSANWQPAGQPGAADDVLIQPAPFQPLLTDNGSAHNLTVAAGASLTINNTVLVTGGDVDAEGGITGTGSLRMAPATTATLRGVVPTLQVAGPVVANGPLTVGANLGIVAGGTFDPADQFVGVDGGLFTQGNGILRMTSANALLHVAGSAAFSGGDTEGALKAGTLRIMGSFNQSSEINPGSFAADGSHLTILGGAGTTVSFTSPGDRVGTSHFGTLRLDVPGDVTLSTAVFANGPLVTTGPTPPIVLGTGNLFLVRGLNVFRLILDNAPLYSNLGVLQRFDDVTFQRYGSSTPLAIVHEGPPAPFRLGNLDFGPPTTQTLISVNDPVPAGRTGFQLLLDITSQTLPNGCSFVARAGEALARWNETACQ